VKRYICKSLNDIKFLRKCTVCVSVTDQSHASGTELNKHYRQIFYIYLFTAIGLLTGGSGYFTCKQSMELVTTTFMSGGLHENHVVATWNVGNHLSICL